MNNTHRQIREYEVSNSDRIELAKEANSLILTMITKSVLPGLNTSMPIVGDLMPVEQETYEAALDYLKRQFVMGHKETEVHATRTEEEKPLPQPAKKTIRRIASTKKAKK